VRKWEYAHLADNTNPAVSRHLTLTFLAPDIVEMILRGKEPSGLALERLMKDMPVEWGEQRQQFAGGVGAEKAIPKA